MTREFYEKISAPFRKSRHGALILKILNDALTGITFLSYPALLCVLLFRRDGRILEAILVPGTAFLLLSIFRRIVNTKRPYELLEIDPLISREGRGKSFPSRHSFSIFVIAGTFLNIFPPAGVLFLFFGILLAAIRVIGGVHFPRDVIVGAIVGILAGLIELLL